MASLHNKRVMEAGAGDVWDVRTTDINEALTRRRYQVGRPALAQLLALERSGVGLADGCCYSLGSGRVEGCCNSLSSGQEHRRPQS